MSLINTPVQPFKTTAFVNRSGKGEFIEVSDQSLKGKWSVLIFMPAAFTFNCPTEVEDAADNYAEFQKAGAEVYIVTTDTHFSHKVWHETSPAVGKAKFPLVGDPTHQLTNAVLMCTSTKKAWRCAAPSSSTPMASSRRWKSMTTRSPATSRKPCASSRPPSTPRAPRPSVPRQVERRRQDPGPVAGPGRQDLSGHG
jgi:peroxiredoxin